MDDQIKNAVRKFDWHAFTAHLPSPADTDADAKIKALLDELITAGHLGVLRPRNNSVRRRDAFCASLASHLAGVPKWADLEASVHAALYRERLIELAFGEIMSCLGRMVRPQLDPAAHVWAAIRYAEDQARLVQEAIIAAIEATVTTGGGMDPTAIRIPVGDQGRTVDPDSQIQGVASLLTSTLKMLSHENGWSDESTGHIVFPPPVETDMAGMSAAYQSGRLADAYGNVRRSAEHLRQFGADVTAATVLQGRTADGGTKNDPVLVVEFVLPDPVAVAAQAAHERLRHFLMQGLMRMNGDIDSRVVATGTAPLPPTAFVSNNEAFSSVALSHLLYRRVYDHPVEYGELTLREWLRGYAYLKHFAEKIPRPSIPAPAASAGTSVAGAHTVRLDVSTFLRGLADVGLPNDKGRAFLDAVTFGQRHDDVFDAPILRCTDGSLHLLPSFATAANLPFTVVSQLATLGADLAWKGKTFERHLLRVLQDKGLDARPVHRWIDGQEVEVDCVLVWDNVVFVIECKNHSLPDPSHPAAISRFLGEQAKAMTQAEEKLDVLRSHPEVMAELFGRPVTAIRWVPLVLNGTPFCLPGAHDGVYIYDMSALGRFLESKHLYVRTNAVGGEEDHVTRCESPQDPGEAVALWAGEAPTAADLLAQLENPVQHRVAQAKFTWEVEQVPMSDGALLITRVVRRQPGGMDAELMAAGLSAAVADATIEAVTSARDKKPFVPEST